MSVTKIMGPIDNLSVPKGFVKEPIGFTLISSLNQTNLIQINLNQNSTLSNGPTQD